MAVLKRIIAALTSAFVACALPAVAGPADGSPSPSPTSAPQVAAAHRAITTGVPAAQTAFDRGLLMAYAFNVGAARDAFRSAEALDPHAVMPYVGEAVAESIDINLPSTADGERRGAEAVRRGLGVSGHDTPADERELLAAAGQRYDQSRPQAQRFRAYFRALQAYAQGHSGDAMGFTLAAYAGWNATGRLTQGSGDSLTPDAQIIAADLDAALKLDPDDVGAHHLRIHFWEQADRPERALSDADYLARIAYDPGESHLQHMAGHIYDRVGDYTQMVRVNEGACANDAAYFKLGDGDGQNYMRTYHEHDVSFVLYGLTTVGRDDEARAFAAADGDYSRELVALRLHDDRAVLGLLGDAVTPMRVVAEARSGDLAGARKDLAGLPRAGGADVDREVAVAAVARAAHDDSAAIAAYRQAQTAAGDDLGDPKTRWWAPVAEALGATLLEAQQPAAAEAVFRSELVRYPNDPHLEFGLAAALAAQGKDASAERAAYLEHWQGRKPLSLADLG